MRDKLRVSCYVILRMRIQVNSGSDQNLKKFAQKSASNSANFCLFSIFSSQILSLKFCGSNELKIILKFEKKSKCRDKFSKFASKSTFWAGEKRESAESSYITGIQVNSGSDQNVKKFAQKSASNSTNFCFFSIFSSQILSLKFCGSNELKIILKFEKKIKMSK